jgi:hypothetical protein
MPNTSRIPRGIGDFNSYITNTSVFLTAGTPTNAERLGILPAELTQWVDINNDWIPLQVKYSDKKNSRTVAVKDQLYLLIDKCVELDQNCRLLDRIAASPNVTVTDLELFGIKRGTLQSNRSKPSSSITEPVSAILQPLGGGSMNVKCYSVSGQRAGILEEGDSVQYVYAVGTVPPVSADDPILTKEISTKAIFTLPLGSVSSGKNLYIYFRWYNTKHPTLAGPWSNLQTILIL